MFSKLKSKRVKNFKNIKRDQENYRFRTRCDSILKHINMFRFQCLNFINSLLFYIEHKIITPSLQRLSNKLDTFKDLLEMKKEHDYFLSYLQKGLFLENSFKEVLNLILKILRTCSVFYEIVNHFEISLLYNQGDEKILRDTKILVLNKRLEFEKFMGLLMRILKDLKKKGHSKGLVDLLVISNFNGYY